MEPGIYNDIPASEYRRLPALSRSDLLCWAGLSKPIPTTVATIGTVFHMAMLEPHLVRESIHVGPDVDRRYKEGKEAWAESQAMADAKGLIHIAPKALDEIRDMVRGVKANPTLAKLHAAAVAGHTRSEVTVVWRFEGVLLKARIDQVTGKALIEWKSSYTGDPEVFAASCVGYNYHVQAAMSQDGWADQKGERLPFIHAVCSKQPPNNGWLHRIPQSDIDHGRTLYQTLVRLYAEDQKKKRAFKQLLDDGTPLAPDTPGMIQLRNVLYGTEKQS